MAGAGAIGGWLGANLAAAGLDVRLLGRPALAQAVARDGLVVTGLTTFAGPVPVDTEPSSGPYDIVFVTCKAHATAKTVAQVAPFVAPDGVMVTLQNGLGNAEVLARHVPPERVVVAVTSHGVTVEAPGRLAHTGRGALRVGAFPGVRVDGGRQDGAPAAPPPGTALGRLLAVLEEAGLAPELMQDSKGHLWLKGAVNAGINPLCALHGIPNGGLREHWDEASELVAEVVALSRAAGVALPGDALAALAATVEATATNRCSMLQDVDAGRPTEIDHITGYFVRLARRLGYPLFANEAVYRRVKAMETSYLGAEAADATMREAARSFEWR